MKLDLSINELHSSDGRELTFFDNPVHNNWDALSWTKNKYIRYCGACQKEVLNISSFTESQIEALLAVKQDVCLYVDIDNAHEQIEIVESDECTAYQCSTAKIHDVPVVVTARDCEAMSQAEQAGFKLVIVANDVDDAPRNHIHLVKSTCGVYDTSFSSIDECKDINIVVPVVGTDEESSFVTSADKLCEHIDDISGTKLDINNYSPFAAYILPHGLKENTRVYLTDIIENITDSRWGRANPRRLQSGYALYINNSFLIEAPAPVEID